MNYYDEEITISGGEIRPTNKVKVERISSRGSNSGRGNPMSSGRSRAQPQGSGTSGGNVIGNNARSTRARQRTMVSVKKKKTLGDIGSLTTDL